MLEVGGASIDMGLLIDPLTAVMLVVVTAVSLLIQVYSLGYMHGDSGFCRYYAYMSLFTAAMLGLVLSSNIVQLYVFWELVGGLPICSSGSGTNGRRPPRPPRKRSSSPGSATWAF